jgi:hypothetical protein
LVGPSGKEPKMLRLLMHRMGWVLCLLLFVVLVLEFGSANLNRFGIVLNILAGFFVAPELIGERRIRSWEDAAEQRAKSILARRRPAPIRTAEEAPSLEGGWKILLGIATAAVVVLSFVSIPFIAFDRLSPNLRTAFAAILTFLVVLKEVVGWLPPRAKAMTLTSAATVARKMANWLEGDDKLRGTMVSFGIATFLLGNFLQLASTYK